jgi:hypothetical protein
MTKLPPEPTPGIAVLDSAPPDFRDGICRHVLHGLGRPLGFLRITARQITEENYRVNVVVGPDLATASIAHSFYVTVDSAGKVTASCPLIVRNY